MKILSTYLAAIGVTIGICSIFMLFDHMLSGRFIIDEVIYVVSLLGGIWHLTRSQSSMLSDRLFLISSIVFFGSCDLLTHLHVVICRVRF